MSQVIYLIGLLVAPCLPNDTRESLKIIDSLQELHLSVDTAKVINSINLKVEAIESAKQGYGKTEQDILGKSSEGGVMMSFYEWNFLKKVKVTYFGEMGNATFEYFVDEGSVIYIRKEQVSYDKPMYFDDSKIASIEESEYYFINQKLLKWKGHQGKVICPKSNQFIKESEQLLTDFNDIKSQLGNYNPPLNKQLTGDTVRCKYSSRCQDSGYVIKGSRSKGHVIHVNPPLNKDVPMEKE